MTIILQFYVEGFRNLSKHVKINKEQCRKGEKNG
jgi:hypothetical protein